MLVTSSVLYDSDIVINIFASAFEREILRKNMQAYAGQ
jgi:hypothetical protein